jgi:hypothetical protein
VRFKVSIDGKPPGDAHGVDVAPTAAAPSPGKRISWCASPVPLPSTFSIEFLDAAFPHAFTFG